MEVCRCHLYQEIPETAKDQFLALGILLVSRALYTLPSIQATLLTQKRIIAEIAQLKQ